MDQPVVYIFKPCFRPTYLSNHLVPTQGRTNQPYQDEEENEGAAGAEDDVDCDEHGEVVELRTTFLRFFPVPLRRAAAAPDHSQIVAENQVRLVGGGLDEG